MAMGWSQAHELDVMNDIDIAIKIRPSWNLDNPSKMLSRVRYPCGETSGVDTRRYAPLTSRALQQRSYQNHAHKDIKLPDIRLGGGHSGQNYPFLTAVIATETFKDNNDRALQSCKKQIPSEDYNIASKKSSSLSMSAGSVSDCSENFPWTARHQRDPSYVKQVTQLRRPFNEHSKNNEIYRRPKSPDEVAAKKRWVVTLRPPSHSADRKLLTHGLQESQNSASSKDLSSLTTPRKAAGKGMVYIRRDDYNTHTNLNAKTDDEKKKLSRLLDTDSVGSDVAITTPFGRLKVTYLDYIASGRPLKCIESYIRRYVMPTYANTHTTVSYTGMQTTLFREEARDIIRKSVNANDNDYVIFTGSGVTSAINKVVHTLKIGPDRKEEVFVFVGPYEHHSNILPWMHTKATVTRIPQDSRGLIDVSSLERQLEAIFNNIERKNDPQPLIIGAFSAASNVTGILTPVDEISSLIHRYNGFVVWDYACAGPYVRIDMNPTSGGADDKKIYKDAVVISPHKFVGGPGTPGVLIAKKWMFQNSTPHNVGGGTVLFVRRQHHLYLPNPEYSEEGGTPAILESIRAGLVFKLKDAISPEYIMKREDIVMKKALTGLKDAPGLVILGNTRVHRLAILPFLFYHEALGRFLHHDFVAMLFNDIFGIQVRSGCACAAPYGLDLLGMGEDLAMQYEAFIANESTSKGNSNNQPYRNVIYKPGFVRFSLPFFITPECLDFVIAAIRMTAMHGWAMLPQYKYNRLTGEWSPRYRKAHSTLNASHLSDIEFKSGTMRVTLPSHDDRDSSDSLSDSTSSSNKSLTDYEAILFKAESLFRDALAGAYDCPEETDEEKGETEEHEEELRWFVKPVEAAHLIHGRQVTSLHPDDLPFMPGALASKIKYNPTGHRGRGHALDNDFIMEYFPDR